MNFPESYTLFREFVKFEYRILSKCCVCIGEDHEEPRPAPHCLRAVPWEEGARDQIYCSSDTGGSS